MTETQLPQGDDVKDPGLRANDALSELVSEHQALDARIRQLSVLPFLTDQQHYEEISLKKKKLALKDRIEAIRRDRSNTGFAPLSG